MPRGGIALTSERRKARVGDSRGITHPGAPIVPDEISGLRFIARAFIARGRREEVTGQRSGSSMPLRGGAHQPTPFVRGGSTEDAVVEAVVKRVTEAFGTHRAARAHGLGLRRLPGAGARLGDREEQF